MPLNSNFQLSRGQRFFQKNGSYGYGAKSRCGPPRVHLGANGVIGSKKWVKIVENYHAPKFEFSTTPRSSIFRKKWKLRLWRQITVETPYGPSWGQWGPIGSKKWVKTVKKLPCLKIRIFDYPVVNNFSQKKGNYGYGAELRWGHPRVHLGANGVPLVKKKWVKIRKKLPWPKIRIFDYSAVIDFTQKMEVTVMAQITVVTPLGPSWGQWGPIGSKKWVKTVKNYHAQKFEFSTTPRSSIFHKKWKLRLWRQITAGTP